eukprot:GCRY01002354.1.p1 GENE.GCRY01002354.1~~GCRY01002354.1.p1  ORF type:complete len:470 (-),score=91.75 GCRY01002354.1:313-1722(-)
MTDVSCLKANAKRQTSSVTDQMLDYIQSQEVVEEAFYIVDLGQLGVKYEEWNEYLPRVHPFYAVKCNNNDEIIKTLLDHGTGFDCASKGEIEQCLSLGVAPSHIIFANPCKQRHHIEYAKQVGVSLFTFDNVDELEKIKEIFPEARVVLRILTDDSKSVCRFGSKFGAHPRTIPFLLLRAQQLQLHVEGVSFHVGSGCMDALQFSRAVEQARRVFDVATTMGLPPLTLLDIGGGFPGASVTPCDITFEEIAIPLAESLNRLFPEESGVRIISEPGRFFACSTHHLAVNVFARRNPLACEHMAMDLSQAEADRVNAGFALLSADLDQFPEEPGTPLFYVNDGAYASFNCTIFDHATCRPSLLLTQQGAMDCDGLMLPSTIFGPTCDSIDVCSQGVPLPLTLKPGDWLYYPDMGAYTTSASTTFNGMPRPRLFYTRPAQKVRFPATRAPTTAAAAATPEVVAPSVPQCFAR